MPDWSYKWDDWFDELDESGLLVLDKGLDFNCQPHSMMVQVRREANRRNVKVSVFIRDNRIEVTHQV